MADDITIAELIRNGTMDAAMAAVLWAAVDEQISFLTVAIPRLAGKSATSNAVLALRPAGVPITTVLGQPEEMDRLVRDRIGGYLRIEEISKGQRPGYIWGEPVQRVFGTLSAGYSIHTALHADGVASAIGILTEGNELTDARAAAFKLILYIERYGEEPTFWRRLVEVYELHGVEAGRPIGHPLFRLNPTSDHFEKLSDPHQFGRDRADLAVRAEALAGLARSGRTSVDDVTAAVGAYRRSRPTAAGR